MRFGLLVLLLRCCIRLGVCFIGVIDVTDSRIIHGSNQFLPFLSFSLHLARADGGEWKSAASIVQREFQALCVSCLQDNR